MPPELTFQAMQGVKGDAVADKTLDLAHPKLPRCTVRIPRASCPGIVTATCPCGSHFAVTMGGDDADVELVYVACWERPAAPAPPPRPSAGPPPGATLFSPRRG
jgi:hypothetical protein